MFPMPSVPCQVSHVIKKMVHKLVELFCGGTVINGAMSNIYGNIWQYKERFVKVRHTKKTPEHHMFLKKTAFVC